MPGHRKVRIHLYKIQWLFRLGELGGKSTKGGNPTNLQWKGRLTDLLRNTLWIVTLEEYI